MKDVDTSLPDALAASHAQPIDAGDAQVLEHMVELLVLADDPWPVRQLVEIAYRKGYLAGKLAGLDTAAKLHDQVYADAAVRAK